MRALIGPDLLRKLPKSGDVRDVKITGFVIRCRPSGNHSYLVSLGRGKWQTLGKVGVLDVTDARAAAAATRSALDKKALHLQADDPTLNQRDARAIAGREVRAASKTRTLTWARYLDVHYQPWAEEHLLSGPETLARLRRGFPDFADLLLSEVSAFGIERWRTARLKGGAKPATVNRDLASLRGALSRALDWGLLRDHPMAKIKASKVDVLGRVRFLNPKEEQRLRDALTARDTQRRAERESSNGWRRTRGYDVLPDFGTYTDHLTPLILAALHTGCRRGELFALRWKDIDLDGHRITVPAGKTGLSRVVPLNSEIVQVLKDWRPPTYRPDAYVFPGDSGAALTDVKSAFLRLMTDAKITGFRFHDLRHTFASKLVQAGVDLNTVRELLGHADLKMTLRYAHLAPEHRAAAVERLVSA